MIRRVPLLVALVSLALGAPLGHTALPPPPIEFIVSPRLAEPQQPITIRLAAAPAAQWADADPVDVYVMWATGDRAAFLRPDGVWSPIPVPFRSAMTATSPEMVMQWRTPEPRGDIPLAMVTVASGANPLLRSAWKFQPVLRSTGVVTDAPRTELDVITALGLLAAAGLAIALVALVPSASRARP